VLVDSSAALQAVTFAALGLGPTEAGAPLFTNLSAKLASSHALSVNHIAVQLKVDGCSVAAPPETLQQSAAAAAGTPGGKSQEADSVAAVAAAPAAGDDAQPSSSTADLAATAPARRSARLQAGAAAQAAAAPAALSPLQRLYRAVNAACPVAMFDDDEADDNGQYLAVWACPQGSQPAPFTGEEGQVGGHVMSVPARGGGCLLVDRLQTCGLLRAGISLKGWVCIPCNLWQWSGTTAWRVSMMVTSHNLH
jgi:hypothetical protein